MMETEGEFAYLKMLLHDIMFTHLKMMDLFEMETQENSDEKVAHNDEMVYQNDKNILNREKLTQLQYTEKQVEQQIVPVSVILHFRGIELKFRIFLNLKMKKGKSLKITLFARSAITGRVWLL
ncbi:hypothetical protein ACJX0J_035736, partial [Zea mays]